MFHETLSTLCEMRVYSLNVIHFISFLLGLVSLDDRWRQKKLQAETYLPSNPLAFILKA